jgi:hypothetical protein
MGAPTERVGDEAVPRTSPKFERSTVAGPVALCAQVLASAASPATATPLRTSQRGRHGERRATAASAGVFARREPELAENRRHVRPSSPAAATIEREKVRICRSFSEPSDGLEPSTPLLTMEDLAPREHDVERRSTWRFPSNSDYRVPSRILSLRCPSLPGRPGTCPQDVSPSNDRGDHRRRHWYGRRHHCATSAAEALVRGITGQRRLVERHRERSEEAAALKGDAGSAAERVVGHHHVPEGELDW